MRQIPYMNGLFVALIAFGGCGSESNRPNDLPPDAPSAKAPKAAEPVSKPPMQVTKATDRQDPVPELQQPFHVTHRAPAVATDDPELDPLVSYLKAVFSEPIKDGGRLIIEEMTSLRDLGSSGPDQHMVDELLKQASEQVPAEMIRDFGEKNRESKAVWPELTRHLPAILLTSGEQRAIFTESPDVNWKSFYEKYPDASALITVSRVGLNRDKTLALFYMDFSRGPLNGHGQLHILKKDGNAWVELPIKIGPSWES